RPRAPFLFRGFRRSHDPASENADGVPGRGNGVALVRAGAKQVFGRAQGRGARAGVVRVGGHVHGQGAVPDLLRGFAADAGDGRVAVAHQVAGGQAELRSCTEAVRHDRAFGQQVVEVVGHARVVVHVEVAEPRDVAVRRG